MCTLTNLQHFSGAELQLRQKVIQERYLSFWKCFDRMANSVIVAMCLVSDHVLAPKASKKQGLCVLCKLEVRTSKPRSCSTLRLPPWKCRRPDTYDQHILSWMLWNRLHLKKLMKKQVCAAEIEKNWKPPSAPVVWQWDEVTLLCSKIL